ncbi:E3 ubiquitin-protein ligase TRIM9 [Ixodes scapularis]|uniref:E3 ubiquitin-protein ligase TRIM9 n=1 Tax=Ixodes scapularis TaxID=6945 RepID=UPI001C381BC4|nr:E3 ubiquitin-protein ligase TRIM9 [Ixodes scapularis]
MEEELKCPACKHFYTNPVLLPCSHSLCLNCALSAQQPANAPSTASTTTTTSAASTHGTASSTSEDSGNSTNSSGGAPSELGTAADYPDGDKLSLLSETDSGVVCTSRPNSYVGTPNLQGVAMFPPMLLQGGVALLSLACPECHKLVYLDENGAHNLARNRALQNIVDKYGETRRLPVACQLCEADRPREASVMCDQCEVFYCDECRENCHPARGPLAKHTLLEPQQGKKALRARALGGNAGRDAKCSEHGDEALSMYCMVCKAAACVLCLQDGRHANHDVQPLGSMCKAQKTELSQNLQALSEKAKTATEFIQGLKGMSERVHENCSVFESQISSQCDLLAEALECRRRELLAFARRERDAKLKALKAQLSNCTVTLQRTTALLQFCIEALKETDHAAFLQIGSALVNRVANVDVTWHKDMAPTPWASPDFDLTLDQRSVLDAVNQLTFTQLKPPGAPQLIPEDSTAENNCVTVAWQPRVGSFVQGYVLELDDGNAGPFREVYCGKETLCTVDGLHFNSAYRARVKAYNTTGEGPYSDVIVLHTAEVAWFALDPGSCHPDVVLSDENVTARCESYEHRVVLGSLGFSRGVHYWEATVDRCDNDADVVLGVARGDVAKDVMLGKDDKGWSMYIDHQRSWFLHADRHEHRVDGGVERGAVLGVLLDLERRQLSFYVNDERQGPCVVLGPPIQGPGAALFPAFSLNRNVQLTVHTALDPPASSSDDSDDDVNEPAPKTMTAANSPSVEIDLPLPPPMV